MKNFHIISTSLTEEKKFSSMMGEKIEKNSFEKVEKHQQKLLRFAGF
jgi:hypothetical protein